MFNDMPNVILSVVSATLFIILTLYLFSQDASLVGPF